MRLVIPGTFLTPFWVTSIIKINQTGSYLVNDAKMFNKSETDYIYFSQSVNWKASCQLVGYSTQITTTKLPLVGWLKFLNWTVLPTSALRKHACWYSETRYMYIKRQWRIRILWETNVIKLTFCCKIWHDNMSYDWIIPLIVTQNGV